MLHHLFSQLLLGRELQGSQQRAPERRPHGECAPMSGRAATKRVDREQQANERAVTGAKSAPQPRRYG